MKNIYATSKNPFSKAVFRVLNLKKVTFLLSCQSIDQADSSRDMVIALRSMSLEAQNEIH